MGKRIVLIHGRAEKPRKSDMEPHALKALINGVKRNDAQAADKITNGSVKFDFAYYGDISNALLNRSDIIRDTPNGSQYKDYCKLIGQEWSDYYEEIHDAMSDDLQSLFSIASNEQSKTLYKDHLEQYKDRRSLDNAFDIVSAIVPFWLHDEVINKALKDTKRYFNKQCVGSTIRKRLKSILVNAAADTDDVCLVAHSQGCIVAYDTLWQFSHLGEYEEMRNQVSEEKWIKRFITLGCPLGETGVKTQLHGHNKSKKERYPKCIDTWHNFSAKDDQVSHDEDLMDDFEQMQEQGDLTLIKDHYIYNMWVKNKNVYDSTTGKSKGAVNPHSLYGYLDNHNVGKQIADWINS